jgi:acetyl-CoA C-acetyltransferase
MIGIGNAERLGVDAVGGRRKRFLRINTGGSTGISSVAAAYYHVASGLCDVVLTAGADKVGECGDSQTVLNKIWDPSFERSLPLGTINMLAMSAVRYMQRYGMTQEDMARVAVKNRRHASLNPNAHLRKVVTIDDVMESRTISWPIKLLDCCPQSTGGAAIVLASEQRRKRHANSLLVPMWCLWRRYHEPPGHGNANLGGPVRRVENQHALASIAQLRRPSLLRRLASGPAAGQATP